MREAIISFPFLGLTLDPGYCIQIGSFCIYYYGLIIAVGFLLLTVTILTGAIWAEQAWSAFWTWDPKEVWALITWIIYAVYLHLRLRQKRSGRVMALFAIIAVPVVLFTFVGVNTIMPGLHSYG